MLELGPERRSKIFQMSDSTQMPLKFIVSLNL